MRLRGRGRLLVALGALTLVAGLLVAVATAQVVKQANLEIEIEGSVSPTKLSKTTAASRSPSNSPAKPARPTAPTCRRCANSSSNSTRTATSTPRACLPAPSGKLQSTLTAQAKAACGPALVGTGRVTAEIAFPEQRPFSAGGPLLIFNGSSGRKQMLIFHVYAKVPAPTTFVTTAQIGKGKGPYGTSARVEDPDDHLRTGVADVLPGDDSQDLQGQGEEAKSADRDLQDRNFEGSGGFLLPGADAFGESDPALHARKVRRGG